ncbi:transcript variant X3 [Nothobranchius furzeri]|uniref:Transcript variant X3 n=1 Tax=Nothobranchius furzeri TaxID=105023 RepID=A0A9D3BY62_NOTFU|nr:transcript variant X3 [Nothobranchius furzeri]
MNGVAFCLVGIPPFSENNPKGRRDGQSSAGDNPRPPLATRPGREGLGMGWKGPRTLVLHKNSQGFGFTLRHFIVYPPESALHTNLKVRPVFGRAEFQRGRLEPMDTIFVKNVREKGPAHQAGLCTGDRLVKVNGESILGKTYSQVIALIQNSEGVLELSIMPKDEDVLQLAYSQDAYLTGNEPYIGGAENLPPPPPLCYPPTKSPGTPLSAHMVQNQLDNWSCWPGSSSPSSPLDNRSAVGSPASWQEGRAGEPGGVGHSSPAHRTEEIQYGMTSQQPQGQTRRRSYSSSSSSGGPLSSPLQVHYPNHHGAVSSQALSRKSSSAWTSPPMPQVRQSRNERCQQALSDWYHSQQPEHSGRSMQTRHRSYSQDRLSDYRRQQRTGGWPHSASQDTLFLLQQSGSGAHGEPRWPSGDWEAGPGRGHPASNYTKTRSENLLAQYDRHGRSLEMLDRASAGLVSARSERQPWSQQASQPSHRTDAYPRPRCHTTAAQASSVPRHSQPEHQMQSQQAALRSRRLPAGQSMDEQQGYRSYSPSFYRKTGRILQAHSFRDPSYSGPHLNWNPVPKSNAPVVTSAPLTASTASPLISVTPESQNRAYRPTNHERERGTVDVQGEGTQTQEVVLRQKATIRGRNTNRNPPFALRMDQLEPGLFSPDPKDSTGTTGSAADVAPRKPNGSLAPLSLEDDSLASIPFIDEPTSPGADLRARHVPASSVVSSGMSPAPAAGTSPASPTFTFPLTRLFSHDCRSIKSTRRSSYLLAITAERSKSCDEGLNTFREGRESRQTKRGKTFLRDGSLDNIGTEEVRSKRHSTSELGNITYSDVRKEGWLHFKQILTEKGKKVGSGMWPWKRVYSVLRTHSLFLYKDKREAVLGGAKIGGTTEDEQQISIQSCLVDIAYSETKKKHTLRLTTQDFCEYLLQAEDRDDMLEWIKFIRDGSKTDSEELFSRQALINKKLNDYRKQSPTSSKPDSSPRMHRMISPFLLKTENASGAPRSPKPEVKDENNPPKSPWGINIMKKTKKAGPKAFGVRLEECHPGVNNKFIPVIVEFCCGLVEEMGLEYTGIYRVPGNNAMVLQLQEQLNKGVDINPAEERWQDLNVVSSLLKSFFRKLPEPLFTNDKYNDFIDANRMENPSERLKTMKKLIRDLPDHYFHTLKFLISHLKTVADHSDKNKMEPRNLALVFGPTLVRTSEDNMKDMVTHMPDRYKIIETLIQHCTWFFTEELDKDEKTPVDTEDVQPAPNIDHLLSNIGRTALLGEASDSTNSDPGKPKWIWGSKKDRGSKDFLALSIVTAVTGRKRRKRHKDRRVGSSTDDDSEQEPFKVEDLPVGGPAPHAKEEEDDEDEEEEEEEEEEVVGNGEKEEVEEQVVPVLPCCKEEEEAGGQQTAMLLSKEGVQAEVKEQPWRAPEDARSIVSGYSTLSTLGRSLGSEGRGDDADDEQSELVSETDNESGFASRSLTQERPSKQTPPNPAAPRSFLYSHCKPPVLSHTPLLSQPTSITHTPDSTERSEGGGARSTTPSSSFSSSSTAHRLHTRPSFNSHKLIQCDTLARKKLKSEKSKARSQERLESQGEGSGSGSEGTARARRNSSRTNPSSASSQESLLSRSKPALPPSEVVSFTPTGPSGRSLAEHVRARLLGSADDLRSVGMRKQPSPETRRKKRAWRRHTVVASPSESSEKRPPLIVNDFPLSPISQNQVKTRGLAQSVDGLHPGPVPRQPPASRFHQYL